MSEATERGTPFLGAFLLRLAIAVIVTGGLIAAILAWNQSASSASGDRREIAGERSSRTRLALADSEELTSELTDVRVVESAKTRGTKPEPPAPKSSTAPAAPDLDPPKLAAAATGSDMALSPVETNDPDLGSAIEADESEEPVEEADGFRLPVGITVSVGGFSGGTVTIGGGAGGIRIGGGGLGDFGRSGIGIITGGGRGCQGAGPVSTSGPIADGTGPLSDGPATIPGDTGTPRAIPTLPSVPNTLGIPVEPTTFGPGSDRELRREAGAEGRFRPTSRGQQSRNLVTEVTDAFSGTGRETSEARPSMRQRVEQALRPQVRQTQRTQARPQAQPVQSASRNVQQARRVQRASQRRATGSQQVNRPQVRRVQQAARPAATRRASQPAARPAVQRAQRVQASRSRTTTRSPSKASGLASRRSEN